MTKLMDVSAAGERFFRKYMEHCENASDDTLFDLLEAMHSLNDRLKVSFKLDFFEIGEFRALKCLRNFFHHHGELKNVIRTIPVKGHSFTTDLLFLCLIPKDRIELAVEETPKKFQEETRQACKKFFSFLWSTSKH